MAQPTEGKGASERPARHEDLRDLLNRADSMGELKRMDGVDWNLEIGALAEMVCQ